MDDRAAKTREILEALRTVRCPGSESNLISAGLVRGLTHCDGAVKAEILPGKLTPAEVQSLCTAAQKAVQQLSWVKQARIIAAEGTETVPAQRISRVIAVASGKGGVGKSTIAVNLAAGLAARGCRTGLLDADIYGPSIPLMLGVRDAKPRPVEGAGGKQLFGTIDAHGVKLMSMGFLVEEDKPVIWRGPMLHGALRQFFQDVAWGELDWLVVDLPPGTGDVALTMAQTVQLAGVVIVSTPQQVAMLDARKALNMFRETGVPVLGIVENMSGSVFGSGGATRWAAEQGVESLGCIALDESVCRSGELGQPAVLAQQGATAQSLRALVDAVVNAADLAVAAAPARKPLSLKRPQE